jgi:hypothetical protein
MNEMEKELITKLQAVTLEHNDVAKLAKEDGRDYITPGDVSNALIIHKIPEDKVRLDVLEVLGNYSGFGVEDYKLTAWIAFEGKNYALKALEV